MKKIIFAIAIIATASTFTLISCSDTSAKPATDVVISQDSLVKRGSYLVNAIGCDDCHSPKIFKPDGTMELDMEHRFGGHLASSPLGKPNTSVMKDGYMLFAMDL